MARTKPFPSHSLTGGGSWWQIDYWCSCQALALTIINIEHCWHKLGHVQDTSQKGYVIPRSKTVKLRNHVIKYVRAPFLQISCNQGCSTNTFVIKSVSQSVSQSVGDPLWKYLQNSFIPILKELGSWTFERLVTSPPYVMCHVLNVTFCMSCLMCHMSYVNFFLLLLNKGIKLVGGGSVIKGARGDSEWTDSLICVTITDF